MDTRAGGRIERTSAHTAGRKCWKQGGVEWRTLKYPPTDASTGALRLVRAVLTLICGGGGTAGTDGGAVEKAPGGGT
eukprot:scaffold4317_cov101-Isochrysis_galbana.AAC.1